MQEILKAGGKGLVGTGSSVLAVAIASMDSIGDAFKLVTLGIGMLVSLAALINTGIEIRRKLRHGRERRRRVKQYHERRRFGRDGG